jgi:predicted XRE-type DNA-binding protein
MKNKDNDGEGSDGIDEIDERYLASFTGLRFEERLRQSKHIGELLGYVMQEQGLSYADMAELLGVDKSTVHRIVHGIRPPERDMVIVWLTKLGLPVYQVSRALMFAGFAPLYHVHQAARKWPPES